MHSNSCKFALDNYHNYHINVIRVGIMNDLYFLKASNGITGYKENAPQIVFRNS